MYFFPEILGFHVDQFLFIVHAHKLEDQEKFFLGREAAYACKGNGGEQCFFHKEYPMVLLRGAGKNYNTCVKDGCEI